MDYTLFVLCESLLFLLALKLAADIFRFCWTGPSRLRTLSLNLAVAVFPLLATLLLIEIALHVFYIRSDFFGFTYAASRWWDTYWKPENSYHYRDFEYTPEDLADKRLVFVLGDSIAAGQGIDQVRDRFSTRLETSLGTSWRVLTIARCGWNTSDELHAFERHLRTFKPTSVVLSYFFNDIEGAGEAVGIAKPTLQTYDKHSALGFIVEHSPLVNLLYWRVYRLTRPELGTTYWNYIQRLAARADVWTEHERELGMIADLSEQAGTQLTVLIFPSLLDPNSDRFITDRVAGLFRQRNITVIDLHDDAAQLPIAERVANSTDHHPGLKVHAIAAQKLIEAMQR